MTATASRKSTGVLLSTTKGRRIAEVLCYDMRLGAVMVVCTDGQFQSVEALNEDDVQALDGESYVNAIPVIKATSLTIVDAEGMYHRFPVRR